MPENAELLAKGENADADAESFSLSEDIAESFSLSEDMIFVIVYIIIN